MNKITRIQGTVFIGFIILALVLFMVFFNLHTPNSGQHTGYVTSVEQSGLIWSTWTAYVKTDPQSSQEDAYCVTDPNLVTELQAASQARSLVTVDYSIPLIVGRWNCKDEPSIINDVNIQATSTDPSTQQSDNNGTVTDDSTLLKYIDQCWQEEKVNEVLTNNLVKLCRTDACVTNVMQQQGPLINADDINGCFEAFRSGKRTL